MIVMTDDDKILTVREIDWFIEFRDYEKRIFSNRHRCKENFENHMKRIMEAKQLLSFRDDFTKELQGICGWLIVDDERRHKINKTTWDIPDNISEGNIFYGDICVLFHDANIFKIREFLNNKYAGQIDYIYWLNSGKKRFFSSGIKRRKYATK